jgi:hypothetical protein
MIGLCLDNLGLRELANACESTPPALSESLHEYVVVYRLQGNHVQDGQLLSRLLGA